MRYSIAIDIGTTTVKSVLFGPGPSVIADASREYRTHHPRPSLAEQNPNDWWHGTIASIRQVLVKSRVSPDDIGVISVSSQAPCVLPVDRDGKPLRNALIWMDRRSTKELEILKNTVGEKRIFDITGNRLDTYFTLTELMWLLRNEPSLMERCHKVLQVNAYINLKLTGVFSIDITHASLTQIMDVHTETWSRELLDAIGADESLMPDIYQCMDVLGHVSEQAAKEIGLSTKTVVLAGAVDATAAALEMGINHGGKVAEMTGTSSVVMIGFDKLITMERLSYLRGRRPGSTILYGPMNAAGGSLKWFRDSLYGGETPENDAYDRMNREVESGAADPSKVIFLPYMTGERAPIWDPDARGCFVGLHMSTSRAQFERAIMEGACFALRDNLDQAKAAGLHFDDFMCCGGCSKSDIWLRIKASVMGCPVHVPMINLGAQGGLSYMNAAYLGEFSSPEEASEAKLAIKKTVEPVKEWVPVYEEMYRIYLESYQQLKKQFKALAAL